MANFAKIFFDVANRKLAIEVVDNTTGERVTTKASITLDGASTIFDGLQNKEMKVMLLHFKDSVTCQPMKMAILGTEPEPDTEQMTGGNVASSADAPQSNE